MGSQKNAVCPGISTISNGRIFELPNIERLIQEIIKKREGGYFNYELTGRKYKLLKREEKKIFVIQCAGMLGHRQKN